MYQYNQTDNISQYPVAMAYVPWQYMDQVYEDLDEALKIGTIFPELDKPFTRGCGYEVRR